MAEHDDPAAAAARLERALERIARAVQAPPPQVDTAELAARLDRLIAEMRAALAGAAGG